MPKYPSIEPLFPKAREEMQKAAIKPDSQDILKRMMVKQGYVPETCTMAGVFIWAFVNGSEDPCADCTENRSICKGRPADPDYMNKYKNIS